jgi:hypothetical protein
MMKNVKDVNCHSHISLPWITATQRQVPFTLNPHALCLAPFFSVYVIHFSSIMARRSKKAAISDGDPKKPGPSGNFQGLRLQFLEGELDTFLSRVSTKSTPAYWPELFSEYWKRVQWHLELSVETDLDMFENASVPIDEGLNAEDEELKSKIFKVTHKVNISKLKPLIGCLLQLTASVSNLG